MNRPIRSRRRVALLLLVLVPVTLLLSPAQARAYEGPVHFAWTYYLALQVGFTERQAFQIASAAVAIDWDEDTGPMAAVALDVVFGSDRALYLDSDKAEWAKMVEENVRASG